MFEKKIYVSHPFQNKKENVDDIENIIKKLVIEYPNYLFLSPVHTFGFLYEAVSYEQGLNYCLDLLDDCDECWVYGNYISSTGCNVEIEYCKQVGIKCKICN